MERNDLLLATDGDLAIEDGDFVVGDSNEQHLMHLLRLNVGSVKQFPLVGFGEERVINGIVDASMRRDMQAAILTDGYRIKKFELDPETRVVNVAI